VTGDGFTWGAHLLMWAFPLGLIVTAVLLFVLEGRRKRNRG
jgi:hypothetical protein